MTALAFAGKCGFRGASDVGDRSEGADDDTVDVLLIGLRAAGRRHQASAQLPYRLFPDFGIAAGCLNVQALQDEAAYFGSRVVTAVAIGCQQRLMRIGGRGAVLRGAGGSHCAGLHCARLRCTSLPRRADLTFRFRVRHCRGGDHQTSTAVEKEKRFINDD